MLLLDAPFYIYYLITISLTRFNDIPVWGACCFASLAITVNSIVLIDVLNIRIAHALMPWLLIGMLLVLSGLLFLVYQKRSHLVLQRFKRVGIAWHFAAVAWTFIFSVWGWFVYKYL